MDTGYSVDVMSQLVYQSGAVDYPNPESFDTGRFVLDIAKHVCAF